MTTEPMDRTHSVYAGIDVSKSQLDLARSDDPRIVTVPNDPDGVAQIVELLKPIGPATIAVEATGGYERLVLDGLLDARLPVALVNPRHVRDLAKGLGLNAKTDAIDARVLAQFARLAEPRLAAKRSKNQAELEALVTCRRQLIEVRTEQRNRRTRTTNAAATRAIDAVLKTVGKQIDKLDAKIDKLIASDDDMNQRGKLLRSAPGVGPVVSKYSAEHLRARIRSRHMDFGAYATAELSYNRRRSTVAKCSDFCTAGAAHAAHADLHKALCDRPIGGK